IAVAPDHSSSRASTSRSSSPGAEATSAARAWCGVSAAPGSSAASRSVICRRRLPRSLILKSHDGCDSPVGGQHEQAGPGPCAASPVGEHLTGGSRPVGITDRYAPTRTRLDAGTGTPPSCPARVVSEEPEYCARIGLDQYAPLEPVRQIFFH